MEGGLSFSCEYERDELGRDVYYSRSNFGLDIWFAGRTSCNFLSHMFLSTRTQLKHLSVVISLEFVV